MSCCMNGKWVKSKHGSFVWASECNDYRIDVLPEGAGEYEVICEGDQWQFRDTFYGTEDEAKAYALDVLHGVSEKEGGISSVVSWAKARNVARKR